MILEEVRGDNVDWFAIKNEQALMNTVMNHKSGIIHEMIDYEPLNKGCAQ